VRPVGEFARSHAPEEIEIFRGGAIAVGAVAARFGERAPVRTHLLGALAIDVRLAVLDEGLAEPVQDIEVVRGVVQMFAPVEAQPAHGVDDGIDVFLLFLRRVGVVEAHVADTAVVLRQTEIQADRLGVAEVQVAVGFGRKARAHLPRIGVSACMGICRTRFAAPGARGITVVAQVFLDHRPQKIGHRGRLGLAAGGGGARVFAGGFGIHGVLPGSLSAPILPKQGHHTERVSQRRAAPSPEKK
jgi:hypothetical protein